MSDQCAPTRPPKAVKIFQIISSTKRLRARSPETAFQMPILAPISEGSSTVEATNGVTRLESGQVSIFDQRVRDGDLQDPAKNPYIMAYIVVPATFLTARVQKMRITATHVHAIVTLNMPMRGTNRAGTTRPGTLEPFKRVISIGECHHMQCRDSGFTMSNEPYRRPTSE